MMWIVRLALKQPYTIVVLAILIFLFGGLSIVRTPTDIFPNIDIPVVSIVWTYNSLPPQDLANRIVTITERNLTTTVDNIEHLESQSLYGIAVVKVFFQPTVSIDKAIAQITANSQTQLRQLPAGTTPPLIISYSASTVPILELGLSGVAPLQRHQRATHGPVLRLATVGHLDAAGHDVAQCRVEHLLLGRGVGG